IWMPARAWVSTSSVTKTFVTCSRWIRDSGMVDSPWVEMGTPYFLSLGIHVGHWHLLVDRNRVPPFLVQAHACGLLLGGHVGEDHAVARLHTFGDLNGVHRGSAEAHGDAFGTFAVGIDPEQGAGAAGLREHGAAYVKN